MRARELFYLLILTLLAQIIIACGPVVRDKKVYEAEIGFIMDASDEQVERGLAVIGEYCKCEEVAGVKGFTTESCQNLAETILVVQTRMKYHTAFMRYLGGLSKKRPPEIPPDVPEANTLCSENAGSDAGTD